MLRRTAKPSVAIRSSAWKLASVVALASATAMQSTTLLAQQPRTNQQRPVAGGQPATQQPSQQFATRPIAGQQPGQQQAGQQQPGQRTASNGNVPLGAGQDQSQVRKARPPIDRAALEQQLAAQMAAQQEALAAQLAKMPFDPLTADQQKYLEMVLDVWEKRTAAIQRYQCTFKRWVFRSSAEHWQRRCLNGHGRCTFHATR